MIKRTQRIIHHERGSGLVELAIVAPLLVLMFIATADVGAVLTAYITLTNASREGARLAARGNVFVPAQVLQVITQQSRSVDLDERASVFLTMVEVQGGSLSMDTQTLCDHASGASSRAGQLVAHYTEYTDGPNSSYLRKEKFAIVEIFYGHNSITGFIPGVLPLYAYTIMPVSAPS